MTAMEVLGQAFGAWWVDQSEPFLGGDRPAVVPETATPGRSRNHFFRSPPATY